MDAFTTWHIRIDIVGEGPELTARAKLVGAPTVDSCPRHATPHGSCPTCHALREYSSWQDLDVAVGDLVTLLEQQHLARAALSTPPTGAGTARR